MFEVGTIVKVIADSPDGSTEKTKGNIGIITRIEIFLEKDEVDYTVSNKSSDYLYAEEQLTEATVDEIKAELKRLLTQGR